MFRKLQPSRTFALAASGLLILLVATLVVLGVVVTEVATGSSDPEIMGAVLSTLQVLGACVATVATGGAGSMALRDFGSKGATSSQAACPPDCPPPGGEAGP